MDKKNKTENIKENSDSPPAKLLEDIANILGVNSNWLTEGEGQPFARKEFNLTYPDEILSIIDELNPIKIYFVLATTKRKEFAIIIQVLEYKFITFTHDEWFLNTTANDQAPKHVKSLLRFIEKLPKKQRYLSTGKLVDEDLFNQLVQGSIYSGVVQNQKTSYWQDNILDNGRLNEPYC